MSLFTLVSASWGGRRLPVHDLALEQPWQPLRAAPTVHPYQPLGAPPEVHQCTPKAFQIGTGISDELNQPTGAIS